MYEKIVIAALGAVFGFTLPYLAGVWDRVRRARRITAAITRELSEVTAEIERKMDWVGRDVTNNLNEVDQDRVVRCDGRHLYLGEREEFTVPRNYWEAKYTEIAEAIPDKDFADFYAMYRLVASFEQKFREMKITFETSLGRKENMALACFNDLNAISRDLGARLSARTGGRP